MSQYTKIDVYLEQNLDKSLAELSSLVAQPSVGAQNWGLQECAALVGEMLRARGFKVRIMETAGAPVVFLSVKEDGSEGGAQEKKQRCAGDQRSFQD